LVLGKATILVHGDEVQGTVQTAADAGNIDIEGEFVAEESEHLVGIIVLHEVDTAADVLAILVLLDELEAELVTAGLDAICRLILGAVNAALLSAGGTVGADGGIPFVTGVTVGSLLGVSPSPVGVDDNRSVDCAAATVCALGPAKSRVLLGG
jgi:hypothetical protein